MARTTPVGESAPPSNTWFLGHTRAFIQNGTSIGSAVFAQLTVECHLTLQCAGTSPPQKNAPSFGASGHPSNTWYRRPSQVVIPNGISISSAVFVWVPNTLLCNANDEETSKTVPPPWDFVTLPEEDRSTAIGNMYRKIGKDRACDSRDILADRQTDTQTHIQTCLSQYLANDTQTHTHTDVLIIILG